MLADEEVEAEIKALPADLQARYLRLADFIEDHGPHQLGMPHVRHLEGKLWELRMKGKDGIARALYITASGHRVIILHAFMKKTQKTPKKALRAAKRRMEDLDK